MVQLGTIYELERRGTSSDVISEESAALVSQITTITTITTKLILFSLHERRRWP